MGGGGQAAPACNFVVELGLCCPDLAQLLVDLGPLILLPCNRRGALGDGLGHLLHHRVQRFHAGQGLGAENCGQCAATIAAAGRVVTAAGELASDLNGAIQTRYLPLYFTNIGIYAAQIQAYSPFAGVLEGGV